jgi:hypothetical protein
MSGPVIPLVPPGSTPLREMARAIRATLTVPEPWSRDLGEEIFLWLPRFAPTATRHASRLT